MYNRKSQALASKMLMKGGQAGLVTGLCPNFIPEGVVCLQYADGTLLFLENDLNVPLI